MNSFQPVEQQNRIILVDALRGLALLGILAANIPFAGNNNALYSTRDIVLGSPRLDNILEMAIHLFVDKKFITIFSILFGFGFYIQMKRAEEKQVAFKYYYSRRMLILLLIGCIHAYIFWFGDIIRDYAIGGFFLLLIYKWPVKRLLITAIVFNVFLTALIFIINGALMPPYSYDTSIVLEHPVTASYWRYLQINLTIDPFRNFIHDSPITLVFTSGNMIIGFCMGKSGFFHRPQQFSSLMKRLMILGATIGILCSYLFWLVTTDKLELTLPLLWLPFVIVTGMLLQSLFYISAFVKLFQYNQWKKFLLLFAPVGKMALTNYILQTFFYLLFFFHWTHGLSLYGKITITETYLVCLILFSVQVIFSHWWLRKHEQGPLETIWKKISYRYFKKTIVQDSPITDISSIL
jgi:uncharacterized protein